MKKSFIVSRETLTLSSNQLTQVSTEHCNSFSLREREREREREMRNRMTNETNVIVWFEWKHMNDNNTSQVSFCDLRDSVNFASHPSYFTHIDNSCNKQKAFFFLTFLSSFIVIVDVDVDGYCFLLILCVCVHHSLNSFKIEKRRQNKPFIRLVKIIELTLIAFTESHLNLFVLFSNNKSMALSSNINVHIWTWIFPPHFLFIRELCGSLREFTWVSRAFSISIYSRDLVPSILNEIFSLI